MFIRGYTWMDNFDIGEIFDIYKIPKRIVIWDRY